MTASWPPLTYFCILDSTPVTNMCQIWSF